MPFTYILYCNDTTLYIGSTNDLPRRFKQHNTSKSGAHYTKIRRPVHLVYFEEYKTLREARKRENILKNLKRKEKDLLLTTHLSFRLAKSSDIKNLMWLIGDSDAKTKKESRKILDERINQGQLLCVLFDKKIVGFVGWRKNHNKNSKTWFLEQITIQKDMRGLGIGFALLQHFLHISKEKKVLRVLATIQKKNTASLSLFETVGAVIIKSTDLEHEIKINLRKIK